MPRIIPISVDQFKEKWRIKSIYACFSYHTLKVLKSFETGISDHHHLIATVFKTTYKKFPPKLLTNRSYKHSWNDSLINKFKSEAYEIQSGDIGSLKHSSEHFKACSFHRSFFWTSNFPHNFSSICAELATSRTSSLWKLIFAKGKLW